MSNNHSAAKRPVGAARPFPWRCRHCGQHEVFSSKIEYAAEVRQDGCLHTFTISELEIPICKVCGEKVFTEQVDEQINEALRLHLKALPPEQTREAVNRLR